jgi:hypothetical protein
MKNAEDMMKILRDEEKIIFALNSVNDMKNIEKEWLFWFGNESFGLKSFYEKLGDEGLLTLINEPNTYEWYRNEIEKLIYKEVLKKLYK